MDDKGVGQLLPFKNLGEGIYPLIKMDYGALIGPGVIGPAQAETENEQ